MRLRLKRENSLPFPYPHRIVISDIFRRLYCPMHLMFEEIWRQKGLKVKEKGSSVLKDTKRDNVSYLQADLMRTLPSKLQIVDKSLS